VHLASSIAFSLNFSRMKIDRFLYSLIVNIKMRPWIISLAWKFKSSTWKIKCLSLLSCHRIDPYILSAIYTGIERGREHWIISSSSTLNNDQRDIHRMRKKARRNRMDYTSFFSFSFFFSSLLINTLTARVKKVMPYDRCVVFFFSSLSFRFSNINALFFSFSILFAPIR
jgi:hypothetical protein